MPMTVTSINQSVKKGKTSSNVVHIGCIVCFPLEKKSLKKSTLLQSTIVMLILIPLGTTMIQHEDHDFFCFKASKLGLYN